jgi:hypothetical protein
VFFVLFVVDLFLPTQADGQAGKLLAGRRAFPELISWKKAL